MIITPKRPIARYHGGKWRLAPWIIAHFPDHRIYLEPFGGAGSVLLRKPRCYSEVYNDLDGEIVNLFSVARDRGNELVSALELTPYSRAEYEASFAPTGDSLEQARRTVVRSFMGFGSNSLCREVKSGFRSCANRNGTTPARDFHNFPPALRQIVDRLRGVVIENRDAHAIIAAHDSPETLIYCDPPYVHSTRTKWGGSWTRKGYEHEMTDADHEALALRLHTAQGKVIVSGYHSPLYDGFYEGWRRVERDTHADGARKRTEVLWMNFEGGGK